jgi:hypothetical protein
MYNTLMLEKMFEKGTGITWKLSQIVAERGGHQILEPREHTRASLMTGYMERNIILGLP